MGYIWGKSFMFKFSIIVKTSSLLALLAATFIVSGCESNNVDGYFAQLPASSEGGSAPTPTETPAPALSAVPNPPDTGVGVSQGSGGSGNVIVYGDEWVARFGDDKSGTSASNWTSVMQPNLTHFWNDALGNLTANSTKKRVLFARFNSAATTWDVIAANSWRNYLPNLSSQYTFTDYDANSDGPLTASYLSNFDALIFVSYDTSLTSTLLTDYVKSGGSIMAMTIGFGVPGASNSQADECLNMNMVLANFPYKYDCGNPNSNFAAIAPFTDVNVSTSALPFNNGYAVIPEAQAETPY
jgi:hypothetical protein